MTKLFILSLFLFLATGCSTQDSVDRLEVEFDGFADAYHKKYNLWNSNIDSLLLNQINDAIDTSKVIFNCPSRKPVMWKINVIGQKNSKNTDQLFRVICNTYNRKSIWKGERCYENDSLIQLMMKVMKVEEIKNFKGEMTQSDYDLILQN